MLSKSVRFSRTQPHEISSPSPRSSVRRSSGRTARIASSLGGEIESLLRLVIVDAMHRVPVDEECRNTARLVDNKSVESSVEANRKRWVFLVEMDEIRRSPCVNRVSLFLQAASSSRVGKLFPGKD